MRSALESGSELVNLPAKIAFLSLAPSRARYRDSLAKRLDRALFRHIFSVRLLQRTAIGVSLPPCEASKTMATSAHVIDMDRMKTTACKGS